MYTGGSRSTCSFRLTVSSVVVLPARRRGAFNVSPIILKDLSVVYYYFCPADKLIVMTKAKRRMGRPPTGLGGEKASEYRRLTLRLPDDTAARLSAIGRTMNQPAWRVIVDAVAAYLGEAPILTGDQRRAVRVLLKLES